ncbi:TraR/DksA family transcriptional regulator [bacterium]|nr:MAG: TraR/DksA family transcriptional regulator [bacterium]
MTKKKLEHYKNILLERRMELNSDLQRQSEKDVNQDRSDAKDTIDQADSSVTADLNLTRREMITQQIKEIDEALEIISRGEYGICENCGEDIPEERLKVRPNAIYCIQCKDEIEKRGKLK